MASCPRHVGSDNMVVLGVTGCSLGVPSIAECPAAALQYHLVLQAMIGERTLLLCGCCGPHPLSESGDPLPPSMKALLLPCTHPTVLSKAVGKGAEHCTAHNIRAG
jgi:hypothetical protein